MNADYILELVIKIFAILFWIVVFASFLLPSFKNLLLSF
jgi:hypothetical protein